MCIIPDTITYLKADHDMVCWKVMEHISDGTTETTVTPYAFAEVTEDILNGEKPFCPDKDETSRLDNQMKDWDDFAKVRPVAEGLIHTYMSVWNSRDGLEQNISYIGKIDMGKQTCVGVSLWKCVIPKGTEYLCGKTNHSYASKTIVFKEKVLEIRHNLNFREIENLLEKLLILEKLISE